MLPNNRNAFNINNDNINNDNINNDNINNDNINNTNNTNDTNNNNIDNSTTNRLNLNNTRDNQIFNMLCLMYSDNNMQINNLMSENQIIRSTITQMLSTNNTNINYRRTNNRRRVPQNNYTVAENNFSYILQSLIPNTRNQFVNNTFTSLMDPVVVHPSPTQIELATRIIQYADIESPINTSCPISLETFTDNQYVTMIRHCRHIFTTNYIQNWFLSNCRCPVCRYDIRDFELDASNNEIIRDTSNNEVNNNNNNNNNNSENESNTSTQLLTSLPSRNITTTELNQITHLLLEQLESGNNSVDSSNNEQTMITDFYYSRY